MATQQMGEKGDELGLREPTAQTRARAFGESHKGPLQGGGRAAAIIGGCVVVVVEGRRRRERIVPVRARRKPASGFEHVGLRPEPLVVVDARVVHDHAAPGRENVGAIDLIGAAVVAGGRRV